MYKLYDFMEARERLSTITVKTKLLQTSVAMMYISSQKTCK